jgi:hypothetical protein
MTKKAITRFFILLLFISTNLNALSHNSSQLTDKFSILPY